MAECFSATVLLSWASTRLQSLPYPSSAAQSQHRGSNVRANDPPKTTVTRETGDFHKRCPSDERWDEQNDQHKPTNLSCNHHLRKGRPELHARSQPKQASGVCRLRSFPPAWQVSPPTTLATARRPASWSRRCEIVRHIRLSVGVHTLYRGTARQPPCKCKGNVPATWRSFPGAMRWATDPFGASSQPVASPQPTMRSEKNDVWNRDESTTRLSLRWQLNSQSTPQIAERISGELHVYRQRNALLSFCSLQRFRVRRAIYCRGYHTRLVAPSGFLNLSTLYSPRTLFEFISSRRHSWDLSLQRVSLTGKRALLSNSCPS